VPPKTGPVEVAKTIQIAAVFVKNPTRRVVNVVGRDSDHAKKG
jgi:hypothetical protein